MGSDRERFGVRAKLLAVLAIPFVTCAAVFAFALASNDIADTGYRRALAWSDHALVETNLRVAVARYRDAITGGEGGAPIGETRRELQALSNRAVELSQSFADERAEEAELAAAIAAAIAAGDRVALEPSAAALEAALRALDETEHKLLARVAEEHAGSRASARAGRATADRLLVASAVGGGITMLLGFTIAAVLTRRVTRALGYLEREAHQLAAGDWNRTIELRSRDELGQLARAFNELAADLRGSTIHKSELEDVVRTRTAELAQSNERHRLLFDCSPVPICVLDESDGRFLAANHHAIQLYGYEMSELGERTIFDLAPEYRHAGPHASASGVIRIGTHRLRCKAGRWLDVEMTAVALELDGRHCVLLTGIDVTEARKLEAQLRQTQKLEGIGQLAGGIAHDFNNILAAILAHADLAREEVPDDHPVRADLDEILAAGGRAAALTRQLLAFSRKQTIQSKVLELDALVNGISKMLGRIIGETISMTVHHATDLGHVRADAGQLEQVLTNLVVNARDAMPDGGQLTIETANAEIAGTRAVELDLLPGPYVTMSVADTGTGIDDITRAHMFEPFFTTKGVGKGTGLGLATVFGIVKQSQGAIEVVSELGAGSTFRIYLPRAVAEVVHDGPGRTTGLEVGGRETILVVEDEPPVRAAVRRRLVGWGYDVLDAGDGPSALALLERTTRPVDLVLTDLMMPGGLSGHALAEILRRTHPAIKIVFMTGHTDVAIDASQRRIMKPFLAHELAVVLRAALDEPQAAPGQPLGG